MTVPILRETPAAIACTHCGEECLDSSLLGEEHSFCCQGCKMVFEILQSNDLCQYYALEENPGFSLKGLRREQYQYLDDPEVKRQFIDFTDGQTT